MPLKAFTCCRSIRGMSGMIALAYMACRRTCSDCTSLLELLIYRPFHTLIRASQAAFASCEPCLDCARLAMSAILPMGVLCIGLGRMKSCITSRRAIPENRFRSMSS